MISILLALDGKAHPGSFYRAMQSVLSETNREIELIVNDGAGCEATRTVVERLARADTRTRLVSSPMQGENFARSSARCLSAVSSSSRFITWMSQNEILLPGALRNLVSRLECESGVDYVFGSVVSRFADGTAMRYGTPQGSAADGEGPEFSRAGVLVRCELLGRSGWLDAAILLDGDHRDFSKRLWRAGAGRPVWLDVVESFSHCGDAWPESSQMAAASSARFKKSTGAHPLSPQELERNVAARYCVLRDEAGWPVTVEAALGDPVDRVPPGEFTAPEYATIAFRMLTYFLQLGDAERACIWAKRLSEYLFAVPQSVAAAEDSSLSYAELVHLAYSSGEAATLHGRSVRSLRREHASQLDAAKAKLSLSEVQLAGAKSANELLAAEIYDLRGRLEVLEAERAPVILHTPLDAPYSDVRLQELQVELLALRHRIADSWNRRLKSGQPAIHRSLKKLVSRLVYDPYRS